MCGIKGENFFSLLVKICFEPLDYLKLIGATFILRPIKFKQYFFFVIEFTSIKLTDNKIGKQAYNKRLILIPLLTS